VLDGLAEWQNRPLDPVYPVIFIDAIGVKIRDGQVANRPIYVALAVTVDGERDILGLWAGDGGQERQTAGCTCSRQIKNRGTRDCCILVCDGLSGLPDAVGQVWPDTIVQTCVVHLLRNSFRYASKKDWPAIAGDLTPVYTAPTEAAALDRFVEFCHTWEDRYPGIVRLWNNAWSEFTPFLNVDPQDPHGHLHHQRDRKSERAVPPGGQGAWALPERAGRAQMSVPGHLQS
jgi:putative transposase